MEAERDPSTDAFHRGRFHLVQPARGGHRAGMDALVLAAAVPGDFAGRLFDFGAGAGAVGMAVAARCPGAEIVLVERSAEMADFARRTLGLAANHGLAHRVSLVEADLCAPAPVRLQAGLAALSADFIVMNPPFNAPIDRATPAALKRSAHVMEGEVFDVWMRSAAAVARPRAGMAIIVRPATLTPVLTALARRFGAAELVAIHARAHLAAIRIVVRAWRGARGGLSIRPPLVLQETVGQDFTQRASAINAGQSSLFGD